MDASILDLRYKMRDVLKALERNEAVRIFYHGKEKGTIVPAGREPRKKVNEHPFFGMAGGPATRKAVEAEMERLRGGRYAAL